MNKWTKGPWICRIWANEELPPDLAAIAKEKGLVVERIPMLGNNGERYISVEGGSVAHVTPTTKVKRGEGHRHVDEERDANAHLISAAPELYEALEELANIVNHAIEQGSTEDMDSFTLQPARAALAKARGEA